MQSVPASWVCERSDREVKRRLRVAEGGSENVSGPQKSAPGMKPGTSISAAWSQDCAAARGLAHGTASGARSARVRESRLTSSTGHKFRGARAAQCRAMKRVERPQPGVVHVQITELSDPRARASAADPLEQAAMTPWIFVLLRANGYSSSSSPSSGVMHRACRREGLGKARMTSSVPVSTLCHRSSRSARACCCRYCFPDGEQA